MADNRTEQATPRRRTKAREKGQVLRARDLAAALTLLAVVVLLAWHPETLVSGWRGYFARSLDASVRADWTDNVPVIGWTSLAVAQWVAPVFAAAFFVAIGATLVQGGVVFAPDALTLTVECPPLSPFPATLAKSAQLIENATTLSPFAATLARATTYLTHKMAYERL